MVRQPSRLLLALALALPLAACEQAAAPRPAAAPPPPPAPSVAAAPPSAPPGHLRRDEVDHILTQNGPPWVLRRIISEPDIRRDGKFNGWRMVGLPDEWRGVDLKPGDVVTRINGLPLETPDDAWEAWKSVARAPELKIGLMRDGGARELVVPIDGTPSPETLKSLGRDPGPSKVNAAAAAPPPAPRRSFQIGGSPPPEAADEETY